MAGLMPEAFFADTLAPSPHQAASPCRRAVVVSDTAPEVLLDIRRPEVNLAVWHRDLPVALGAGLRPLAEAAPFTAVVENRPEAAVDALVAKLPAAPPLDLLLDIRRLALAFAAIADTGGVVRVRLEAITGPACHRWHADAVGLRLLCTYRGPGTEWLAIAGGARTARGLDPKRLPGARGRLATGAAAILKGEGFSGNAGFGCIHRSPPAGPGERARLLLCLDEPGRIPLE
jgi:hypothetical protein